MALNSLGLGFIFRAVDFASPTMLRIGRNFRSMDGAVAASSARMSGAFRGLALGIAGLAAAAITLGPAISIAKESAEFQLSLKRAQFFLRSTDEEIGQVRASILDLGRKLAIDISDSVEGFESLGRAGFRTAAALDAVAPAAEFATAANLPLAKTVDISLSLMRGFAIQSGDLRQALNRVAAATTITRTNFQDLTRAVGDIAEGAQVLGVSLEDSILAFGLTRDVLQSVERSSTAVRRSFQFLAKEEKRALFERAFGVKIVRNAATGMVDWGGTLNDMIPRFLELERSSKGAGGAIIKVFGVRASSAVLFQMRRITQGFDNTAEGVEGARKRLAALRAEIVKDRDIIGELTRIQLESFAGQMKLITSRFKVLREVLGPTFTKALRPTVEKIAETIDKIITFVQEMDPAVKDAIASFVVRFGTIAGIIGVAALSFAALKFVIGGLIGILGISAASMGILGAVIVTAGLGLAAFDINLKQSGSSLLKVFGTAFKKIRLVVLGLVELFTQGFISQEIGDELTKVENESLERFVVNVFTFVQDIKDLFSGIGEGFAEGVKFFKPAFDLIGELAGELGVSLGPLGTQLEDVVNAPQDKWREAGKTIGRVISAIVGGIQLFIISQLIAINVVTKLVDKIGELVVIGRKLTQFLPDPEERFGPAAGEAAARGEGLAGALGGFVSSRFEKFLGLGPETEGVRGIAPEVPFLETEAGRALTIGGGAVAGGAAALGGTQLLGAALAGAPLAGFAAPAALAAAPLAIPAVALGAAIKALSTSQAESNQRLTREVQNLGTSVDQLGEKIANAPGSVNVNVDGEEVKTRMANEGLLSGVAGFFTGRVGE